MPQMISFLPIVMLFLIIFITRRNEKLVLQKIQNRKRRGEKNQMFELAQKFLEKECIVYTFNTQVTGTVKEVKEGGILLKKEDSEEIINFDYIVRIREYPRGKNGKKKSVIFD